MKRIVTVSEPDYGQKRIVQAEVDAENPYGLVESFRKIWKTLPPWKGSKFAKFEVAQVLPIHNLSGIRDRDQIVKMTEKIKTGSQVVESDGLPNVKLVATPNKQLLLFDGTHTLLAYYLAGKKFLWEVPYLLINTKSNRGVSVKEIAAFFPEDFRNKVRKDWQRYVVNWQAKQKEQLGTRESWSLKELAGQLSKGDKSSVKQ